MPRRPRRNHSPAFKAKVALEAIKGEQPLITIAEWCCLDATRQRNSNPQHPFRPG